MKSRQRQISYDITYMENLKKKITQMNIFTKQRRLTDFKTNLLLLEAMREVTGNFGVWDWHIHIAVFKTDNQGPTVQHRELCSVFCNNLNGKRI